LLGLSFRANMLYDWKDAGHAVFRLLCRVRRNTSRP
jgi:hypothetical protein